ncbi:hypothetical protein GLOTRDRAFT_92060 [Gloeophyllum trabeum ATCC 11539]|uniref:Uncharacterized protein n=1 Tax=Gloeophyllum trabeum (strain ATCC 11539 / FP-39264 / Madison 617) TaxID=670483 RepID=S7QBV0_GLOTA|nr:uncharacterized protein GLOTRDRAFT_92060 [Gloeophyllum trabeum ATCC 11539]EPQ56838.1 hypothetical protein GLOTRDRAFT_92060 [Gloeophyllum trabeum ATCC 11539]
MSRGLQLYFPMRSGIVARNIWSLSWEGDPWHLRSRPPSLSLTGTSDMPILPGILKSSLVYGKITNLLRKVDGACCEVLVQTNSVRDPPPDGAVELAWHQRAIERIGKDAPQGVKSVRHTCVLPSHNSQKTGTPK